MKDAVNSVLDNSAKIADAHQEFSNQIINDITKPLETWSKNKENDRKKIVNDGLKHIKVLYDAKSNAIKNKENYEKGMKEAEMAKEVLLQCEKAEINSPDDKKLQQATRKASQKFNETYEKAKKLETVYKTSVNKANEELETFKTNKMPPVLELSQKWEEERWNLILNLLRNYKSRQEEVAHIIVTQLTNIIDTISRSSIEEDFKLFVECVKKEDETTLSFVPFKVFYFIFLFLFLFFLLLI